MPIYTFYAFIGCRGAKQTVYSVDSLPLDWLGFKMLLLEAARKIHFEHGVTEAELSLEKHLPGGKIWRQTSGSYILKPCSFKRSVEALFTVVYNPKLGAVTVKHASFLNYKLMGVAYEFMETEKGVVYRVPPIVPKHHKSFMENPKGIFEELSALRFPNYSRVPKLRYSREYDGQQSSHTRTYLPRGDRLREQKLK